MKNLIFLACALCAVQAVPVPAEQPNELEILQIPLQGNKELDIVSLADDDGKINDRNKRTIGILRELFPELSKVASNGESTLDIAALNEKLETINRVVRQTAAAQQAEGDKLEAAASDSQRVESKAPAIDELSLDNEETDDNRNKRFLSFGFGGSGGSGGGGSGNFLFDIIRLVSGSTGTEHSDEKDNAADDGDAGKSADGYTEGIPGPVTRLFVLANRGLANLVQDLILRIAQTSERVVNFKARLITSLI
ncbi:uncharacterized protein LOC119069643 isoform X5 [Bradysia coprophila]|uniref:uncharacterized protein LOC119069643 isoform X5 n=1 Tax=Bradysia coprophila TaxID=38358 RepID=UPI00187DA414|nr:uncharacterized protein LOC119069643 isoform X5 [Bradysia coprophila]